MSETSLIVGSQAPLAKFSINDEGRKLKLAALENSALIARVTDRDSKIVAVRAQQELKSVIHGIEKARQKLKEPLLQACRQLDTLCATESLELEKEYGRISQVVKEFDDAERRRVAEEERLQREELARIERAKQVELKRIADEQAAREAEARRAKEEADRLVAEARTKKAKAAAEAARIEAERKEADARENAKKTDILSNVVEERASDAAFAAGKPIEITTVSGQRTAGQWKITKINDWTLAKARPDLVREIKFDLVAIKSELNRGVKLAGLEAEWDYTAGVKLPANRKAIDV